MGQTDEQLHRAGLKATGPRRKILQLFELSTQRHLTAEDVYQQLNADGDQTSLATVYRVLAQFESAGLLQRRQHAAGKAIFELSRLGKHNHFVCLQCGRMECFTDREIDSRQTALAEKHGFEVSDYSLYTYVNCVKSECPHRDTPHSTALGNAAEVAE